MIGKTIAHYRICGELGVGGMGVVYEADDTRLLRRVALKFLPEDLAGDPAMVRRFQREAQTIALLNHPNICIIYDVGEHEGRRFIVMEYLEGVNLKVYMATKALETAEIVDIALQIADALDAAHAKGIVHRDVKPANVVINTSGQVKVVDFGLARRFRPAETDGAADRGSTIVGRPLGTANYMAPERILQIRVDSRSDLFSLGVMIYEMATRRPPFGGASPLETVTNILDRDPIPLTRLAPHRPIALERIVNKLLTKSAAGRYQSAKELRAVLATMDRTTRR